MEPGHIYCYYKPTFINGFEQLHDSDINFNFLQALEGQCRDELTVKQGASQLLGADKLVTEEFVDRNFDKMFQSSYSVQWTFNPNMRQFKKKISGKKRADKPIILVYCMEELMSNISDSFKYAFS